MGKWPSDNEIRVIVLVLAGLCTLVGVAIGAVLL